MNRLISFGNSDDEFPIYIMQATKDKKIGILDGGGRLVFPWFKNKKRQSY